jgi:hypothetical protein
MSSHRARLLASWTLVVIVLGFFLNLTVNGGGGAGQAATDAKAAGPHAVAPIYVPRPLALLYGSLLNRQSSAVDVAKVFIVTYFTYDTGAVTQEKYLSSLPRVADSYRKDLTDTVAARWKGEVERKAVSRVNNAAQLQTEVSAGLTQTVISTSIDRSLDLDGRTSSRIEHVTVTLSKETGEWQVVKLAVQGG